ncbi:MAG TPA: C40 family peptidase [Bacteroidota bacterium]|nr:C40 family peptidase [Bacteroidota bacterium]
MNLPGRLRSRSGAIAPGTAYALTRGGLWRAPCAHPGARLPGAACALLAAAVLAAGCATTSPRFRATGSGGRESASGNGGEDRTAVEARAVTPLKVRPWEDAPLPAALNRDRVLLEIVSLLGVPYAYGGTGRDGMDCSSFTETVYAATGVQIPRSTADQFVGGTDVSRDRLRFGDLVFFGSGDDTPSHVGIYIEDDLFAHASVTYGVIISSLETSYYRDRYIGARRIVN